MSKAEQYINCIFKNYSKYIVCKFYIEFVISVVLMLYMPVVFGGYFFYGENTKENILLSLPAGPMTTSANILIAVHLILAFLILANPISQGLEEILNVPQGNRQFFLKTPIFKKLQPNIYVIHFNLEN